jgi:hypothetical protein
MIATSKEKGSFSIGNYKKKLLEDPTDINSVEHIEFLLNEIRTKRMVEENTEWQKNNLEYDLRSSVELCQKVKDNQMYAQNLYAALCNNEFQKLEVIPILKEERWSCSWRYAGGIIADMNEKGDYIDWYCSGISDNYDNGRVSESTVTDEVRKDLLKLGWKVIEE